ncbi:MAG: 50S ribosomal protein L28 [Chlamydiae bacterium]|nr:50S ribosomal protein L28 [Chlamydiota bacterium]MBI3278150.1 50S ribosomal protein L28 [Chlamydiota bacterium]
MSQICVVCGKKPVSGHRVARRGLSKRKGGVGENVTGITLRRFMPNLQRVRALIKDAVKTVRVCTRCLKANKIQKAA